MAAGLGVQKLFQSTLPGWGATAIFKFKLAYADISIHAPRVGSDEVDKAYRRAVKISIHAPRVGSDSSLSLWLG